MWAILCDARKGQDYGISHLALVDRTQTEDHWWTSDKEELVFKATNKNTANKIASRFVQNNATVVDYDEAIEIIRQQAADVKNQKRIQRDGAKV